jgi:hypothetical protein
MDDVVMLFPGIIWESIRFQSIGRNWTSGSFKSMQCSILESVPATTLRVNRASAACMLTVPQNQGAKQNMSLFFSSALLSKQSNFKSECARKEKHAPAARYNGHQGQLCRAHKQVSKHKQFSNLSVLAGKHAPVARYTEQLYTAQNKSQI